KIHIDVDASSINKSINADIALIGCAADILEKMLASWNAKPRQIDGKAIEKWWKQIGKWREVDCLSYDQTGPGIKPQYFLDNLNKMTLEREPFVTTDVGQHQMWSAQFFQ